MSNDTGYVLTSEQVKRLSKMLHSYEAGELYNRPDVNDKQSGKAVWSYIGLTQTLIPKAVKDFQGDLMPIPSAGMVNVMGWDGNVWINEFSGLALNLSMCDIPANSPVMLTRDPYYGKYFIEPFSCVSEPKYGSGNWGSGSGHGSGISGSGHGSGISGSGSGTSGTGSGSCTGTCNYSPVPNDGGG